jgi:hypothetical protein
VCGQTALSHNIRVNITYGDAHISSGRFVVLFYALDSFPPITLVQFSTTRHTDYRAHTTTVAEGTGGKRKKKKEEKKNWFSTLSL